MNTLDKDGFTFISEADITPLLNIQHCRNEFSPFSDTNKMRLTSNNSLLIDCYYGQAYSQWLGKAEAI
jgi:hypothetical protein